MAREDIVRELTATREIVKDILDAISHLDYMTVYAETEQEKRGLEEGHKALVDMYTRYVKLIHELQDKLNGGEG